MEKDVFQGMEGLTQDAFSQMVRLGRGVGNLNLCRTGDRWVLLFRPPGSQGGKTCFLMAKHSRKPRLFAKADTALGVARTLFIGGLWVDFTGI